MKNTLKEMEIKIVTLSEWDFLSLFKKLDSLRNNVYQQCLISEDF